MGLNKLMPLTVLPATTRGVVSQPSATHRNFLRPASGKCLHYYFYFMDDEFGVVCLRVPTWCPFRLQFYCNGHGRLASQLTATGLDFAMADNAFVGIADWQRAQPWPMHCRRRICTASSTVMRRGAVRCWI